VRFCATRRAEESHVDGAEHVVDGRDEHSIAGEEEASEGQGGVLGQRNLWY
jgi:hypothetical protein